MPTPNPWNRPPTLALLLALGVMTALCCRGSGAAPPGGQPAPAPAAPAKPAPTPPAKPEPTRQIPAGQPTAKSAARKSVKTTWTFGDKPTAALPLGFKARRGKWAVEAEAGAPGANMVLAQLAASAKPVFNLVLQEQPEARHLDVELYVRFKSVKGKIDQGGGLVWRAGDERNYYITRYNPLENNLRIYTVKEGRRRMLKSARVARRPGTWRLLRVRMKGDHLQVFLDGKKHFDLRDTTFGEAGAVGLWTKADAVTLFDDLHLEAL